MWNLDWQSPPVARLRFSELPSIFSKHQGLAKHSLLSNNILVSLHRYLVGLLFSNSFFFAQTRSTWPSFPTWIYWYIICIYIYKCIDYSHGNLKWYPPRYNTPPQKIRPDSGIIILPGILGGIGEGRSFSLQHLTYFNPGGRGAIEFWWWALWESWDAGGSGGRNSSFFSQRYPFEIESQFSWDQWKMGYLYMNNSWLIFMGS